MTFIDTSVCVAGLIDFGATSVAPREVLAQIAQGKLPHAMTAWHCCLELYSVVTRLPEEYRLSPGEALSLLESEVLARLKIVDLPARNRRAFLRDAAAAGVWGGRLHDAHLAAIALAHGTRRVVTENVRHFAALEHRGVSVLSAAAFLER